MNGNTSVCDSVADVEHPPEFVKLERAVPEYHSAYCFLLLEQYVGVPRSMFTRAAAVRHRTLKRRERDATGIILRELSF